MPITLNFIFISNYNELDLDPNEAADGAENAGSLIGQTFGDAVNPLVDRIDQVDLHDGNDDHRIALDGPEGGPSEEYVTYQGYNYHLDSCIIYTGTVTYADGTTVEDVTLRIVQAIDSEGRRTLTVAPPRPGIDQYAIDPDVNNPIQSITITGLVDDTLTYFDFEAYADPTCFRNGTMILTERGNVAVEDLRVGDMVITRDHGPQPLRWIGGKQLGTELLGLFDKLRPVRIRAGALGYGLPRRDLYVSQQHRILVSSKIAERMFGAPEVLVAAKHLTEIEGIEIDDSVQPLTYYHLLFDRHEIVCSEGAQTESLFTGTEALKTLPPAARAEIMALFPELVAEGHMPQPARRIGNGREGRRLAQRHSANRRELQQALIG